MARLRVSCFSISVDGYGAGSNQNLDNPLGAGGLALHDWMVPTRTFQRMKGTDGGATGPDDDFMARGFANIGAWILGRGTTFHFVTDGIHAALQRAAEAAKGQDVRVGGGVATIRQYLQARLIDEMHIAISPILLGSGEHLFDGIDAPALGYECTEHVATANAMHLVLTRRP